MTTTTTPLIDASRIFAKAMLHEGKPYLFGRKGPDAFDCSGLVTWSIRAAGGPNWVYTHNAQILFKSLMACEEPKAGEVVLAFYGRNARDVDHVMFALGDGRAYGACGGDSSTTTLAEAAARNARVQFRTEWRYRRDFLGFRNFVPFQNPSEAA